MQSVLSCFGCTTELDDDGTEMGLFQTHNPEVVAYCRTIVNAIFEGETSNVFDNSTDHNEMMSKEGQMLKNNCSCNRSSGREQQKCQGRCCCGNNLGLVLRDMNAFIRTRGELFTGNEDEFLGYLEQAVRLRFGRKRRIGFEKFRRKILRDKTRFVELIRRRKRVPHSLHHVDYWATRQQLRAGKVIADWIDRRFGPLDPIFGALLCPTGGRTGPGDSDVTHAILFDDNGPIAYHSAVHDAFGYLLNFHNTGPGYKYLGAFSIFRKDEPMCEQVAGVEFWTQLLENSVTRKQPIVVY
eukprot:gene9275-10253_t